MKTPLKAFDWEVVGHHIAGTEILTKEELEKAFKDERANHKRT